MSMSPPTVVLVHGTWHTPAHYKAFTTALEATGLEVYCPLLPTCNGSRPPDSSFCDDVATIRSLVMSLVQSGKRILLIMHSYGGVVGSSALDGLSLSQRSAEGLLGGVVNLIYACAYILPVGSSMASVVREVGYLEIMEQAINIDDTGTWALNDPAPLLYGDLSPEVSAKNVSMLVRTPKKILYEEAKSEPWREISTTYVFTEKDGTCLPVYQKSMIEKVQAESVELRVIYLDCGHTPFLSRTQEIMREVWKTCNDSDEGEKKV